VFRALVALRRTGYRMRLLPSRRADVPVIVIGNLIVGGSGKTPLVLWVAEFLKAQGFTPGIVSRGYGGNVGTPREATIASEPFEVGDEPIVLARRSGCTVWVGSDRVRAAASLRGQHPEVDVLIFDDGLQHYRMRRDIEIAVVDARGFGNGFMLPAGPLREPPGRLRSVDAVVAHGTKAVPGFAMRLVSAPLYCLADARDRRPASAFADKRVHAVAGIGDPNRFFLQLAKLGIKVMPHAFPDHHPLRPAEIDFADGVPVVMTEKDAVKCRRFAQPHYFVLPVNAELDPAFGAWLLERLGGRKAA